MHWDNSCAKYLLTNVNVSPVNSIKKTACVFLYGDAQLSLLFSCPLRPIMHFEQTAMLHLCPGVQLFFCPWSLWLCSCMSWSYPVRRRRILICGIKWINHRNVFFTMKLVWLKSFAPSMCKIISNVWTVFMTTICDQCCAKTLIF